jgi:hypothetical protein
MFRIASWRHSLQFLFNHISRNANIACVNFPYVILTGLYNRTRNHGNGFVIAVLWVNHGNIYVSLRLCHRIAAWILLRPPCIWCARNESTLAICNQNCYMDFYKFRCSCHAATAYPTPAYLKFLQVVIPTWRTQKFVTWCEESAIKYMVMNGKRFRIYIAFLW